jgi:hypothetical protein
MPVVVHGVGRHLGLDGGAQAFHPSVRAPRLVVAGLLAQMVVLERLLRPNRKNYLLSLTESPDLMDNFVLAKMPHKTLNNVFGI